MIKLVPAKCPNCGSSLELDDNLRKTKCEFCKTTIVVDEAIQKYEVELKGKVSVSGLNSEQDNIDIVKKYLKVGKIGLAYDKLEQILENNPFNLDALETYVSTRIKEIEEETKIKLEDITYEKYDEEYGVIDLYYSVLAECVDYYETIVKIDEKNKYKKFKDKMGVKLENYSEVKRKVEAERKRNWDRQNNLKKELIEVCKAYVDCHNYTEGATFRRTNKIVRKLKLKEYPHQSSWDYSKFESYRNYSYEEMIEIVNKILKRKKLYFRITLAILLLLVAEEFFTGHWFFAIVLFLCGFYGVCSR